MSWVRRGRRNEATPDLQGREVRGLAYDEKMARPPKKGGKGSGKRVSGNPAKRAEEARRAEEAKRPKVGPKLTESAIGTPVSAVGRELDDGDGDGFATPPGGTEDNVPVPPKVVEEVVEAARSGVPTNMLHPRDDIEIVESADELRPIVDPIIENLGRLHGVPKGPPHMGSFLVVEKPDRSGARGEMLTLHDAAAGAIYSQITINPDWRQRSEGAVGLTFLHEFGHRLDITYIDGYPEWHSGMPSPAMDALWTALNRMGSHAQRRILWNNLSKEDREYALSKEELWARLYSQWAAERLAREHGITELLNGIRELTDPRNPDSGGGFYQFSRREMSVLGPLVENVLRERGLLA